LEIKCPQCNQLLKTYEQFKWPLFIKSFREELVAKLRKFEREKASLISEKDKVCKRERDRGRTTLTIKSGSRAACKGSSSAGAFATNSGRFEECDCEEERDGYSEAASANLGLGRDPESRR
jgi:hypothetical protein